MFPTIAIVGRPNVGKSSLFNRLLDKRVAIVADEPGTTRDRVTGFISKSQEKAILVDTGGISLEDGTQIDRGIRIQVNSAIQEADVLMFVVDTNSGILPIDQQIANLLRTTNKPVLLVANKADTPKRESTISEFYKLGMGTPYPVSALHRKGIGEMVDEIFRLLPNNPEYPDYPEGSIPVAIIGRPNVGKSSLINSVLGENRTLVSAIPGTTRDAIDTEFQYGDTSFVLIDTAGIRRKGHISPGIEKFSVSRALQAVERAKIAVLVVDATEYLTAQDLHVAGYVQDAYKGLVLVINKWDLAQEEELDRGEIELLIRRRLQFFPDMPIIFTSAMTGKGVMGIFDAIKAIEEERMKRITTSKVNRMLMEAISAHPPPTSGKKRLQIYYGTQAEVDPPTFVFFTNDASLVHFSYKRYLENTIRKHFGFKGTAIKTLFRSRSEESV
ncbi:MAG: ribosome biogenesis GTPase Der [Chloroflexota bacterium]|nr:ribosome biogenesis GTPase Der [Chloroflexota bacterium]